MPITPFKAMNFSPHEVITKRNMDQMNYNLQFINDNTPRGRYYRLGGEVLNERTVLVAGKARIKKNKKRDFANTRVRLGKAFSPTCRPHVTTGVVAGFERKIFCVVSGPKGINYPNANGFQVHIKIAAEKKKQDKVQKDFWVHWHAFGYRQDDMDEF